MRKRDRARDEVEQIINQNKSAQQRALIGQIGDMTIALLVIASVYAVMSLASSIVILWEAVVTGILALILFRTKSRGAALLLIVMSVIAILNGLVSVIGAVDLGTRNLPLAFISLWCAWRSLQATIALRGPIQDLINPSDHA